MFNWFTNLPTPTQLLIIYLVSINIITFFYFGLDKLKSQLSHRRVSEKTLWILSAIGGSLGALLGMNFFRHKTKKLSFQAGIAVILAGQICLILLLI
ncbi:DUF1294 domain-containing protein [Patescibacteria group bacterium]|nr:DUF1294 domain-containing protein [Patescibacteria group bacterium]